MFTSCSPGTSTRIFSKHQCSFPDSVLTQGAAKQRFSNSHHAPSACMQLILFHKAEPFPFYTFNNLVLRFKVLPPLKLLTVCVCVCVCVRERERGRERERERNRGLKPEPWVTPTPQAGSWGFRGDRETCAPSALLPALSCPATLASSLFPRCSQVRLPQMVRGSFILFSHISVSCPLTRRPIATPPSVSYSPWRLSTAAHQQLPCDLHENRALVLLLVRSLRIGPGPQWVLANKEGMHARTHAHLGQSSE